MVDATKVIALLMLGLATATPALGQRNELAVDASIFHVTAGYARVAGPRVLIGIEVGAGLPQINRTLTPATDQPGQPDFAEFLHVGAFARFAPTDRFEVDTGLRGSVADLWECTASDCWPQPFAGAYVQPMFGWTRVKVGGRLTAGWIGESRESSDGTTFLAALSPFIIRATFPL